MALFQFAATGDTGEEIFSAADDAESFEYDEFSKKLFFEVYDNLERIDALISDKLVGWSIGRISKTSLSILRLSAAELLYFEDIPNNISINEAVELAKTYCGEDEYQFVNGVLGSIVRTLEA